MKNTKKIFFLTILTLFTINISFSQSQSEIKREMVEIVNTYGKGIFCKNNQYKDRSGYLRDRIRIYDIVEENKKLTITGEMWNNCYIKKGNVRNLNKLKKIRTIVFFTITGKMLGGEFTIQKFMIETESKVKYQIYPTEKFKF